MEQSLSAYKIFYEVASCSNISKAAKKLYISQPAISKAIVKLEDNLDTKLFQRNSRGVTLTDAGERLFSYIKEAFTAIRSGEAELQRMKEYNIGYIRIGTSTTLCRYVLLPYLQRFIEQFPNIRVSIITNSSDKTISLLEQSELDIGLVAEPKVQHGGLKITKSQEIHDIFVATPQYMKNLQLICGKDMDFFSEANLLLLDQSNISRRFVDNYFKNMGIEPIHVLEADTMDLLIKLAKINIGASCVVREFVKKDLASGKLLEIPLPSRIPSRRIGFIHNTRNLSKSLDAFLQVLERPETPMPKALP